MYLVACTSEDKKIYNYVKGICIELYITRLFQIHVYLIILYFRPFLMLFQWFSDIRNTNFNDNNAIRDNSIIFPCNFIVNLKFHNILFKITDHCIFGCQIQ